MSGEAKTTTAPSASLATPQRTYVSGGLENLEEVLNHIDSGVVAHAADTAIRVCNPRACTILGLTMDQMIGVAAPDPQWRFQREDGSPMPLEEFPVSVVLKTRRRLENLVVGVNRPATGDVAWAQCNGFPVFDAAGELELIIITFIDVTEKRRAEEERQKLEAQLRQAVKMEAIGRLAGGIAHDFNNLLTGILGYAEFALDQLGAPHPAHEPVTQIRRGGERAAELTRQLLAFARKQVIEPRVVHPNEAMRESESLLRRLIGEEVVLQVVAAPDVRNIRVDPTQLDQILVNLAVNARDAMPGGGRLVLETSNAVLDDGGQTSGTSPVSGEFVQFTIRDDGEGMPPEVRDRIFEPFFSTKNPGEGTGLGLATVYGIVRQSGGVITVDSEPGRGTTFRLYFPAVDDAATPQAVPPAVEAGPGTETILLVEDNAHVRELVRQILATSGYTVLVAGGADEALLLEDRFSGPIDLVLSDVVMPGLSGRELYAELKARRPSLCVLFMSGYTEDIVADRDALGTGAGFLSKPFTREQLRAALRALLD